MGVYPSASRRVQANAFESGLGSVGGSSSVSAVATDCAPVRTDIEAKSKKTKGTSAEPGSDNAARMLFPVTE